MQGVRGNIFFAIFATTIAIVAVIGFTTLRKAQHLRFAISIHTVPESPYHDLVPLGQPILLRIDKASAGRSPLKAFGYLLDVFNAFVGAAEPAPVPLPPAGSGDAIPAGQAQRALRAKATAFFEFYRESPRDLDLGFYLFHGMQPRGLTPRLNEQLNARLRDALAPTQQALIALGLGHDDAQAEVTALFAHIVGLLLLSHTGRIRMFRQESQALFDRYLDALIIRTGAQVPHAPESLTTEP